MTTDTTPTAEQSSVDAEAEMLAVLMSTGRDNWEDRLDAAAELRRLAAQVEALTAERDALRTSRAPLSDERMLDFWGESNRGFCITQEDYEKAFRDAERAHGIRITATEKEKQA